jgi:hypothetical protein
MSDLSNATLRRTPTNSTILRGLSAPPRSLFLLAGILTKLAKHLALIACLLIVGEASGRSAIGEVGIFLVVLAAGVLHLAGQALQRRQSARLSLARLRQ